MAENCEEIGADTGAANWFAAIFLPLVQKLFAVTERPDADECELKPCGRKGRVCGWVGGWQGWREGGRKGGECVPTHILHRLADPPTHRPTGESVNTHLPTGPPTPTTLPTQPMRRLTPTCPPAHPHPHPPHCPRSL